MRPRNYPLSTDRYQPEHYSDEVNQFAAEMLEVRTTSDSRVDKRVTKQRKLDELTRATRKPPTVDVYGRKTYHPRESEDYIPTKFVVRGDEEVRAQNEFNHKKFIEEDLAGRSQVLHRSQLNVRDSQEMSASLRHHSWMGPGHF